MSTDILDRLDHEPSYVENSDAKQLRRDAAAEIRALRHKTAELEALIRRDRSKGVSRMVAA